LRLHAGAAASNTRRTIATFSRDIARQYRALDLADQVHPDDRGRGGLRPAHGFEGYPLG
jgi:hypothetical protein